MRGRPLVRGRGLKPIGEPPYLRRFSRPLVRGRGLKQDRQRSCLKIHVSPACTGAWIETILCQNCTRLISGRPLVRGRGLKLTKRRVNILHVCRPLVRGRGLKPLATPSDVHLFYVARLYGGVD